MIVFLLESNNTGVSFFIGQLQFGAWGFIYRLIYFHDTFSLNYIFNWTAGFSGDSCENDDNFCTTDSCMNEGTCVVEGLIIGTASYPQQIVTQSLPITMHGVWKVSELLPATLAC